MGRIKEEPSAVERIKRAAFSWMDRLSDEIADALDADVDVEAPKITGGKDDQDQYRKHTVPLRSTAAPPSG